MNTQAVPQPSCPVEHALACVMALIRNHSLLCTAVREAAHHQPASEGATALDGHAGLQRKLDDALGDGLRSITGLHIAAASHHFHLQPDQERRTARHALACLSGFLAIHEQMQGVVRQIGAQQRSPRTDIWPSVWANLTFQLDEMRTQARASIDSIASSARHEAGLVGSKAQIFGSGQHDFEVLVTLQTTAHRFFHVRADDVDAARETALEAAQDEQGAHFVLIEGNFVTRDDVHVNLVNDDSGNEL